MKDRLNSLLTHLVNPVCAGFLIVTLLGIAGIFRWKNNILTSEDSDSYEPDMPIWGFHEFEYGGQTCLDILTDKW